MTAHLLTSMMRAHVFWPALLGRLDPASPRFRAEICETLCTFLAYYNASRGVEKSTTRSGPSRGSALGPTP
jgi:hypothetical protein